MFNGCVDLPIFIYNWSICTLNKMQKNKYILKILNTHKTKINVGTNIITVYKHETVYLEIFYVCKRGC